MVDALPARRGCLVFIGLWACAAAVLLVAGTLAVRGDIVLPHGELRETRLWLVAQEGNQGLGLSSMRFASGGEDEGAACVETWVRFLLWQAREGAQATHYCECFEREGREWVYTGVCRE